VVLNNNALKPYDGQTGILRRIWPRLGFKGYKNDQTIWFWPG